VQEPPTDREPSLRDRFTRLIGAGRRERLITAATVIALVVAIAAFIALPTDDDADEGGSRPTDPYTARAERICLDAKVELATAGSGTVADPSAAPIADYARQAELTTRRARERLAALEVPPDRRDEAAALDARLRDAEAEIERLGRLAGTRTGINQLPVQTARVEAAGQAVEEAVAQLGLKECAELQVGLTRLEEGAADQ
jgi:hypothetical protein